MIESFKQLEESGRGRDLAEVFLEVDEQEHGIPGEQILSALRKRREIMRDALAVMGENSRMGVIVAAPTAGAGGVVPGMLLALEEERHVDPEKTVRALVACSQRPKAVPIQTAARTTTPT